MKIIASPFYNLDAIRELRGNEPAILVFPEGCWNGNVTVPRNVRDITLEYRVSIIGTKRATEEFDVAFLVKNGQVTPVNVYPRDFGNIQRSGNMRELYSNLNLMHNVSPTDEIMLAIVRQNRGIYEPVNDNRTADLVLVSSTVDHTIHDATKSLIVEANSANITQNTLCVQAVLDSLRGTDIFALPRFERIRTDKSKGYAVCDYSKR